MQERAIRSRHRFVTGRGWGRLHTVELPAQTKEAPLTLRDGSFCGMGLLTKRSGMLS
jgi:hypothetical protein